MKRILDEPKFAARMKNGTFTREEITGVLNGKTSEYPTVKFRPKTAANDSE